MITHDLIQGTPDWHAYRATHFNASDAPAMMGVSPYKTRSQLLHEVHTGLTADIDPATQRRFDDGHRFEALARPLAENIIEDDLYPVTGSSGKLSASFDGLTLDEATAFEHKTLNEELRAVMVDGCTGADLPLTYQVQMEQQCMVSGAGRVLFMASKWDGNTLVEERHCCYHPNLDLRAKITAGWAQFEADLCGYVPAVVVAETVGRAPELLPALRIEVTGMVTASNLNEYKTAYIAVIKAVNKDLRTDQQFSDAEKTVKWCADIEERLAAAKQHALSQTASIDALFRTIDDISAEARATRLELDKLVKARKVAIRDEIMLEAKAKFAAHYDGLNNRLGRPYLPRIDADFAGVVKGLKTVSSLRNAVDTELARVKIEANDMADKIGANLLILRELGAAHHFLFSDAATIVLKQRDDLTALVKMRIAEHEAAEAAKLAAQREQIRIEEEAKAAAKVKAEQEAAARAAQETERQAQVAAQAAIQQAAAPAIAPALAVVAQPALPVASALPIQIAPVTTTSSTSTIKLGEITERLGFSLPAAFLAQLGFEPVGKDRAAVLYRASDFPRICQALINHIAAAVQAQAA